MFIHVKAMLKAPFSDVSIAKITWWIPRFLTVGELENHPF
jgi:hypothetical protein